MTTYDIFNYKYYLDVYPDLNLYTKQDAYNHWDNNGKYESRNCIEFDIPIEFDHKKYLNKYPDLINLKTRKQAFNHYITKGTLENRIYPKKTTINDIVDKIYILSITNKINIKNINYELIIYNDDIIIKYIDILKKAISYNYNNIIILKYPLLTSLLQYNKILDLIPTYNYDLICLSGYSLESIIDDIIGKDKFNVYCNYTDTNSDKHKIYKISQYNYNSDFLCISKYIFNDLLILLQNIKRDKYNKPIQKNILMKIIRHIQQNNNSYIIYPGIFVNAHLTNKNKIKLYSDFYSKYKINISNYI